MKTSNNFFSSAFAGVLTMISMSAWATPCADLLSASIPDADGATVEITQCSVEVAPVAHLKIKGTIDADTSDTSKIIFQMRLPDAWNGRFFMGGDGGFAGDEENETFIESIIVFQDFGFGGTAIERGYAVATTDTGHQGGDGSWALDDVSACSAPGAEPCTSANSIPGLIDNEREINYAYRGIHLTAVAAKSIIDEHYNTPPAFSYFHGCSNGGRQALYEAIQYPEDFDGIIAGAPAGTSNIFDTAAFINKVIAENGSIDESKVQLLHSVVLEKCDAATDGISDGIINDPSQCNSNLFNVNRDLPKCKGSSAPDCFTSKELNLIKNIYRGLPNLNDSKEVQNSQNVGSEGGIEFIPPNLLVGWANWITGSTEPGTPLFGALFLGDALRYVVFDNPSLNPLDYLSDTPMPLISKELRTIDDINLPSRDLNAFRDAGGKILLYQGWNDPAILASATIGFYQKMTENADGDSSDFARLYMMPGVAHCADGPGPQLTDMASSLAFWVEGGDAFAPNEILAFSFLGFGRPLCPFPQLAEMIDPLGDPFDFTNFECVAP